MPRFVQDGDLRPGRHADRAGLARTRRQRITRDLMRALGHAVGFDHRTVKEGLQFLKDLRRQRCR